MHSVAQPLPPLTIDKSFAHGVGAGRLEELAREWTLVVPTAFYYEIFTTDPSKRRKAIKDLPDFRRFHLPYLFRDEKESGLPKLSADCLPHRFANYLSDENWQSTDDVHRVNDLYNSSWVQPQSDFWREVLKTRYVPGFVETDISRLGSNAAFESFCEKLRDLHFIRAIASQLRMRHVDSLDDRWFTFRYLQCQILHGLSLLRSYHKNGSGPNAEAIEHDLLDLDYLMLGLHCGALATKESLNHPRKMGWRFKKLCPKGHCITA